LLAYLNVLQNSNCIPSIISLQETWLYVNSDSNIFHIPGYKSFFKECSASKHGGLVTYVRDDLKVTELNTTYNNTLWEGQFLNITLQNNRTLTFINIYRPPQYLKAEITNFNRDFEQVTQSLRKKSNEIVITGDFNIDLLKITSKPNIANFFETLCGLNLLPKITCPTRFDGNSHSLIDNIFVNYNESFSESLGGILTNKLSDHQPIFLLLKEKIPTKNTTLYSERRIGKKNY